MNECPIFNAELDRDYRVIGVTAQPPGLRRGDHIRIEEKGGRQYRRNLTSGEEILLYHSLPNIWLEPME